MDAKRKTEYDAATRAQLIYAFRRIFSPLARILQRAGVPYNDFRDILKAAYTEAAIRDGVPGYTETLPTTAALAALTGIPLADIENLVENPDLLKPPAETSTAVISAILTKWSTDTSFQGPYGLPRQLALTVPAGKSFSDLVRSVREDADPAAIMQEMIINGTVEKVGPRHVKMSGRQLVFGADMQGNLFEALGRAMEDLAATINHNQSAEPAKKIFQRSVFSDKPLPISRLPDFSELTRSVMQEALVEIDDWLTKTTEQSADEPTIDVGVTVFEYQRRPVDQVELAAKVRRRPPARIRPAWIQPATPSTGHEDVD